jgi:hypothetical protein
MMIQTRWRFRHVIQQLLQLFLKERKLKKIMMIQIAAILLGASLLAGCAQAAVPNANPTVPAVSAPVSAPTVAPLATVAALATPTSKPSTASSSNACTLLTNADVNKVLGHTFEPVAGNGQYGLCAYTFQLSRVDLTITNTGGTQYMKINRTQLAEMALDVPGLGDEAFFNVNSSTLFVRKGDAMYLLSYLDSMVTQDDKIAKDTILAGLLLSRLN